MMIHSSFYARKSGERKPKLPSDEKKSAVKDTKTRSLTDP